MLVNLQLVQVPKVKKSQNFKCTKRAEARIETKTSAQTPSDLTNGLDQLRVILHNCFGYISSNFVIYIYCMNKALCARVFLWFAFHF